MVRTFLLPCVLFLNLASYVGHSAGASAHKPHFGTLQKQLRVALIGFTGAKPTKDSRFLESALAEALGRNPRLIMIDQSMIQAALKGISYDGSINMSKQEARRLGAAIGCDFFIVGKAQALTRSTREKESHEEAYAGVMFVDARTGAPARFDFISEKAPTGEAAMRALVKELDSRAGGYVERMIQVRASAEQTPSKDSGAGKMFEDFPDEGSPRAVGFKPPEFLNRVRPEYTTEASQADMTATVEAMVVFGSNGEVGEIEIIRWAGFGLDESSERAIRQLKFKPAIRDGKVVSVRALIRYNFRRVSELTTRPEQPADKPLDKPERDPHQLFKPTYRRP